jgi:hypothetical protein
MLESCFGERSPNLHPRRGSVAWSNARAWRAREPKGSVGSNPTLSALRHRPGGVVFSHPEAGRLVYCPGP